MPAQKKSALRVVVPVVVGVACAAFILVMLRGGSTPPAPGPAGSSSPTSPVDATDLTTSASAGDALGGADPVEDPSQNPAGATSESPERAEESANQSATPEPEETAAQTDSSVSDPPTEATVNGSPAGLRARVIADAPATLATIGGLDPARGFRAEIAFTALGAGVESITLSDFYKTIRKQDHYQLQQVRTFQDANSQTSFTLASLSARQITINGQSVDLFSDASSGYAPVWREEAPGSFECMIVDQDDAPVVHLRRQFTLAPGSYEIAVRQTVENLTDQELTIEWVQYGPIELPEDIGGYRLKIRRLRFGHLWEPQREPTQQIVFADGALRNRSKVIDRWNKQADSTLWPRPTTYKRAGDPVWVSQTSRYFAFAVHPLIDEASAANNLANPNSNPIDKGFDLAHEVNAVVLPDQQNLGEFTLLTQLTSTPLVVGAGESLDLSFAAYAGPLGRRQLSVKQNPVFGALGLSDMVIYNIGGPCAFCTFQWLARFLISFLTIIHDYVVFDWALAIMLLVVCVRTLLHPITKRSQIGIMRFSKQMQGLAPKQQKLRERYKDEPKRLNQEMMKLMKEEGVSYTGMLGCLPMFLQTPIWIALYAMLYFSFDLRHEAAFFGIFQAISGGAWPFLADLSSADNFIPFGGASFSIPVMGNITGFNVLPILLGVVFFIQQKYLTPPPSATTTPEQQAQQRMIKVMMVVMMPVFLYNAPSGLSIYFITNSMLGILESRYIRSHVDKEDLIAPKEPADAPGRKKIKSKSKAPASPFKKDRSEERQQFKRRK